MPAIKPEITPEILAAGIKALEKWDEERGFSDAYGWAGASVFLCPGDLVQDILVAAGFQRPSKRRPGRARACGSHAHTRVS